MDTISFYEYPKRFVRFPCPIIMVENRIGLDFSCLNTMTSKDNKPDDFQKINPEDYSDYEDQLIKKGGGGGGSDPSKKGSRTIRALKNQGKLSTQEERRKITVEKLTRVLVGIRTGDDAILEEYLVWLEHHSGESYKFDPKEVEISFARSSGPGGQNVNRRETKVSLTHKPTLIRVSCEETRSQGKNRQLAQDRLQQCVQDHLNDWRNYLEPDEKIDLDLIQNLK